MVNYRKYLNLHLCVFLCISLGGCLEKDTDDPSKSFEYWSGEKVSKGFEIINGKYWESSHWSKEYILYLEFKAPRDWINDYKRLNGFHEDKAGGDLPNDAPYWFNPPKTYKRFVPDGFNQGTTLFEDSASGHVFLYEIQL